MAIECAKLASRCSLAMLASLTALVPLGTPEQAPTKNSAKRASRTQHPPQTLTLAAVGDINLARYVERQAQKTGYDALFDPTRKDLKAADLTVGNLECVLGTALYTENKRNLLRAKPESAKALANAGFDVLSVANNHALDCGRLGLTQTLGALAMNAIHPIGAKREALVIEVKGIKIAFLAYCDFPDGSGGPGINYSDEPLRASASSLRALRGIRNQASTALTITEDTRLARSKADLVVILWHWGTEGSDKPNHRQKRLAKLAADAGADLILGSHPHVLQPVEWLPRKDGRRCLVAYSLGNFVFDASKPAERKTAILKVELTKGGVQAFTAVSCQIQGGIPIPARPIRAFEPGIDHPGLYALRG